MSEQATSVLPPKGVFPQLGMNEEIQKKIKEKRSTRTWLQSVLDWKEQNGLRAREIDLLALEKSKEELLEVWGQVPARKPRKEMTPEDIIVRWPALTAHLICESLGYATPTTAANIILDMVQYKENWCEWIYSCYGRQPGKAVRAAIRKRSGHKGYMAEFKQALALVFRSMLTGDEPTFASWF